MEEDGRNFLSSLQNRKTGDTVGEGVEETDGAY